MKQKTRHIARQVLVGLLMLAGLKSWAVPRPGAFDFTVGGLGYRVVATVPSLAVAVGALSDTLEGPLEIQPYVKCKDKTLKVSAVMEEGFSNCHRITSVSLPSTVATIGDEAFGNCRGLETAVVPGAVTQMGAGVFVGCVSLRRLTLLPELATVPFIENDFMLDELVIGSGVKTLAFEMGAGTATVRCRHLVFRESATALVCDRTLESLRPVEAYVGRPLQPVGFTYPLELCSSLQSLTLAGKANANGYRYDGCTALRTLTLCRGVSSLAGDWKFCRLESLNLTGPYFVGCTATFSSQTYLNCTVTVPAGTAYTFRRATGWSRFWEIKSSGKVANPSKAAKRPSKGARRSKSRHSK